MKTGCQHGTKWVGKFYVCITAVVFLAGISAIAQGTVGLTFSDSFARRAFIFGNQIWGTLSNATSEAGEPYIDGVSSGQTVWGTWIAPSNGIVTLSAEVETFSPLLTVYMGDALTNLSLVASNNYLICYEHGACGCHWRERNQITFHVTRGQPYQICVDSAIITDASWELENVPVGDPIPTGAVWAFEQTWTFGSGSNYWSLYVPVLITNEIAGGNFQLGLQFTPAPNNDDFEQRAKIQGSRLHFVTSNAGATKQAGEPNHSGNPGGSSVWFSWTAPASGRVTLSTNEVAVYAPPTSAPGDGFGLGVITILNATPGPPTCGNEIDQNPPPVFYPVFAAYTGTAVDALTNANALPMLLDAFLNGVEFDAVQGQTYQIAFDGNMGTTGDIPLYLALTTPPPNDSYQHSLALQGVSVTATGYNAGAAVQPVAVFPPGVPLPNPPPANQPPGGFYQFSSGKDVWWSWTAPVSGTVSIDLDGSDYSFPVSVATAETHGANAWIGMGLGQVSFTAVQGHPYRIVVGDYNGLTGGIKLTLQAPIIDLPLLKMTRKENSATLVYTASAGEVAALLSSTDNANWRIVRTQPVLGRTVAFQVKPAPTLSGPFYRAIIFDRISK